MKEDQNIFIKQDSYRSHNKCIENLLTFVLIHTTVTILLPITPPGEWNAQTDVFTLPLIFSALCWRSIAVLDRNSDSYTIFTTFTVYSSKIVYYLTFSSEPSLQSSSPSQSHSFCKHSWLCGHRSCVGQRGGLVQSASSERSAQSAYPSHLRTSDMH